MLSKPGLMRYLTGTFNITTRYMLYVKADPLYKWLPANEYIIHVHAQCMLGAGNTSTCQHQGWRPCAETLQSWEFETDGFHGSYYHGNLRALHHHAAC